MIITDVLWPLFFVHQAMFWIWYWQLKEYRRDRLVDGLKNDGRLLLARQFDLFKWYRPKMTMRAAMIVATTIIVLCLFSWFFIDYMWTLLLLVPFFVSGIIGFWTPLFNWLRQRIVDRAKVKMQRFKGKVIGITGSYGKSSTKETIAWVLSAKYKVVKTPHNHNSLIGIAQTILKDMKGDEDYFVVEMGAYRQGEIEEMCKLVRPKYGIITGLGDQHLSLFGSLENIIKAKMELIEALPKDGLGMVADKDFVLNEATHIEPSIEGISFEFDQKPYWIAVKGSDKLRNVIGSIKMLIKLGMKASEIALVLRTMPAEFFSPKLVKLGGNYLLDDSYNASLESIKAGVDYLKVFKGYKKMMVTSGLLELGSRSKLDHKVLADKFRDLDKIIITNKKNYNEMNGSDNMQLITQFDVLKREIVTWMKEEKRVVLFSGRTLTGLLTRVEKELE